MNVHRRVAFPPFSEGVSVFAVKTVYVSEEKDHLHQEFSEIVSCDTFGNCYARRSNDNGTTWSRPILTFSPEITPHGVLRRSEHVLLHDPARKRVIRFSNQSLYSDLKEYTLTATQQTIIQIEISEDEGLSFSPPSQLIVKGGNAKEWAPDVCYGENSSLISFSQPTIDRAGRIILPAHWISVLPPQADMYIHPMEAACFIGETDESGALSWIMSERVAIDPALSVRGLCEPTISELSDGRLLMICRGSNMGRPDMPARKWLSISTDGGLHWSEVEALGYDSGELFYSPGSGSRLIRSSFNGKLYWIGNIVPENPDGGIPRYPLSIAEVDEDRPALRKATLFQIDTRRPEDSPRVQLSNFHAYEDRANGDFVILLARLFEQSETCMISPAYEYRVSI